MSTISNTPVAPIIQPTPAPSISADDINALLQIVDLASQRGAFKGPELTNIGQVFDRVSGFLKSVSDQQKSSNPDTSQTPASIETVNPIPMNIPANNLPPQHSAGPIPSFLNKGIN